MDIASATKLNRDHPGVLEALSGAQEALLAALPYVTDVVDDPEQRACFKQGVPQRHAKQIKAAIAQIDAIGTYDFTALGARLLGVPEHSPRKEK